MKRKSQAEIMAFLSDLRDVCKKHQLSLSHEDSQGAFCVINYDIATTEDWMMHAFNDTTTDDK